MEVAITCGASDNLIRKVKTSQARLRDGPIAAVAIAG
jgi:hypothetical protein